MASDARAELEVIADAVVGESVIADRPGQMSRLEKLAADIREIASMVAPSPTVDREALGRKVREVWIDWATQQLNPKASWLVPWEGLSEPDREVDRRIGERVAAIGATHAHDAMISAGWVRGPVGQASREALADLIGHHMRRGNTECSCGQRFDGGFYANHLTDALLSRYDIRERGEQS
jgi:hypothetical protein